jgi:signal transduction histidine kinase
MNIDLLFLLKCLIETSKVFFLLQGLFEKKYQGKKYVFLFLMAIFLNALIMTKLSYPLMLNYIVGTVTCYFLASILYSDAWYIKIASIVIAFYMILISDMVVSCLVILISMKDITLNILYLYSISNKLFYFIIEVIGVYIIMWIYVILKRANVYRKRKEWIIITITFFSLGMAVIIIILNYYDSDAVMLLLILSVYTFIVSVMALYFFSKLCDYFEELKRSLLLGSGFEGIKQQLFQQDQANIKIRKMYHDMNNHIKNIEILLKSNEQGIAIGMVDELKDNISSIRNEMCQTSGNSVVDAIVNYAVIECGKKKIKLTYDLEWIGATRIKSIDISSILSNLLDNAITAAQRAIEPYVDLKVFEYKNYIMIIVKNSYLVLPNKKGNRLITVKKINFSMD